jgi:hypothetical protein
MVEVANLVGITLFTLSKSNNCLMCGRYLMEYSVYDDHEALCDWSDVSMHLGYRQMYL